MEPSLEPGTFPAVAAEEPNIQEGPPEEEQSQSPPCQRRGAAEGVLGPESLLGRREMLCASCKVPFQVAVVELGAGALQKRQQIPGCSGELDMLCLSQGTGRASSLPGT